MVLLDSSAWVALVHETDVHHEKAKEMFSKVRADGEKIVLPYIVAAETVSVLSNKVSKRAADLFLEAAINNNDIHIINNNFPREAVFYLGFNDRMSFPDLSVLHLTKQYRYQLMTFDQQQLKFLKKTKKASIVHLKQ